MAKLLIICLLGLSTIICGKSDGDKEKTSSGDKTTTESTEGNKKPAGNDTVYFAQWNGKKIIIEDNYKYAENEKKMTQETGSDYGAYGDRIKELVKKYGKYNEQTYEYYIDEYHNEFADYTSLKKGKKMYVSTARGVYPIEVNGYYINMDDMIGGGAILYAAADVPEGTLFDEREMMVASANSNMSKASKKIDEQAVINKFIAVVLPKLKDIKVTIYNEKTQKEETKKLEALTNEDISVFKGSFTGAGKDEYLVGIKFNNEATSFTSALWVMDAEGNVIKEVTPLTSNNFTFSEPFLIMDSNGDNIQEIITYDGYYEGGGYNFTKYDGSTFKLMTTGFVFGV